jgi:hypothetical protein
MAGLRMGKKNLLLIIAALLIVMSGIVSAECVIIGGGCDEEMIGRPGCEGALSPSCKQIGIGLGTFERYCTLEVRDETRSCVSEFPEGAACCEEEQRDETRQMFFSEGSCPRGTDQAGHLTSERKCNCTEDSECTGIYKACVGGVCRFCGEDRDCTGENKACVAGFCQECREDINCRKEGMEEREYCNSFTNNCQSKPCERDDNCPDKSSCIEGVCRHIYDDDEDGFLQSRLWTDEEIDPESIGGMIDCDDETALCTNNCDVDADRDGIADCMDVCFDSDRDGFCDARKSVFYEDYEDLETHDAYVRDSFQILLLGLIASETYRTKLLSEGYDGEALREVTPTELKSIMRDINLFDCKDNDASIKPGAEEVCDYKDNDCDGEVDECELWIPEGAGGGGAGGGAGLPVLVIPRAEPEFTRGGNCNMLNYGSQKSVPVTWDDTGGITAALELMNIASNNTCVGFFQYFYTDYRDNYLLFPQFGGPLSGTVQRHEPNEEQMNHLIRLRNPSESKCTLQNSDYNCCFKSATPENGFIGEFYWQPRAGSEGEECDWSALGARDGICQRGFCIQREEHGEDSEVDEESEDERPAGAKEQRCVYTGRAAGQCKVYDMDGDGYKNSEFECVDCFDCNDADAAIHPGAVDNFVDGVDQNCNGEDGEMADSEDGGVGDGFPDRYEPILEGGVRCSEQGRQNNAIIDSRGCWLSPTNENMPGWSAGPESATAYIVRDGTAPEGEKSLYVSAGDEEYVAYSVGEEPYSSGLEPGKQYILSFYYKLDIGEMQFSVNGEGLSDELRESLSGSGTETTWTMVTKTFTAPGERVEGEEAVLMPIQLIFTASGGEAEFYLDAVQLTEGSEQTKFVNFNYEVGCCPQDYCWTGGMIEEHPSCIQDDYYENNVSMPPIGINLADFKGTMNADERGGYDTTSFLDAPNGYRCINGTWTFSKAKFTPLYDGAGYCPKESQCFNGSGTADAASACVESGIDSMYGPDNEYFYCYEGNWTTRTKEIALQMLKFADEDDEYTIFCDKFDKALNPDETNTYYRDYIGDDITLLLSEDSVNEFCVMNLNGQVIAGVSLNTEINAVPAVEEEVPELFEVRTETKSFMQMLKGNSRGDYCNGAIVADDEIIEEGEEETGAESGGEGYGEYRQCSGSDVYYNDRLKTAIFTKPTDPEQAVPFGEERGSLIGGFFERLRIVIGNLLGIKGLTGSELETMRRGQTDFIKKAGSFDKLYISYSPDEQPREIKAIREMRAQINEEIVQYKTFISAEYHNYKAPICRFFYQHNHSDVRNQISNYKVDNIQCTPVILDDNNWMYEVYVEEPVLGTIPNIMEDPEAPDLVAVRIWRGAADNFWNDITAKIRTQEPREFADTAPEEISFVMEPGIEDNPVVGEEITFTATDEREGIIARTWEFGDRTRASSAFNVSVFHTYEQPNLDGYNIILRVMNENYMIRSIEIPVVINQGPVITFVSDEQTGDAGYRITIRVSEGNAPYNIQVNWNYTEDQREIPDEYYTAMEGRAAGETTFNKDYSADFERTDSESIEKRIEVIVVDARGVESKNRKTVIVHEQREEGGRRRNILSGDGLEFPLGIRHPPAWLRPPFP